VKRFKMAFIGMAIVITAAIGFAEPLTAAGPKAESKQGKSQHRTFSSPNAIIIPDNDIASPYPSTIKVKGFKKAKITDVNLRLRGINHGWSDDVDVLLVAPDGDSALVMSDVGGSTNALSLTLTMDDEASASLPDVTTLQSGTFRPTNHGAGIDIFPGAPAPSGDVALSTFNGGDPNGTWRLFVLDDDVDDSGAFSGGWDLKIKAKGKKGKK
jgi:large repetitive protein